MASFTDELTNYNPYVAQIPVEAYVNTGIALQGRYDQNVQRIQSVIEQVGQLPVAGEANKQYLAQRTSELRSKAQSVATADFSKNNLVGQIQGMASQLAKDPTVQAGIMSAQRIQQLQSHIEDVRKNKPEFYSDANAERALDEVNKYMQQSQTVAGLTYGGPTAITVGTEAQVKEKMLKGIKELNPDIQISWTENGNLVLKSKDKELSPEKVKTMAQSMLTADDMKILSNAGWYNTRGMNDQQLMQTTADYYAGQEKHYITQANDMLDFVEKTENLTPEQKTNYINKAKYFQQYAEQHGNTKNNIVNGYKNGQYNRDMVTTAFWTNRTIDGFGSMAYKENMERDIKINPNFEVAKTLLEMEKMKMDMLKTEADIEKTRRETSLLGKPKPGESPDGNDITPTAMPIVLDDVNGRLKDVKDNDIVQEQIRDKDKEVVNTYDEALKTFHSTVTSNGDKIIDTDKLDSEGNLTDAAKKEAIDGIVETDQSYKNAAFMDEPIDPATLPIDPKTGQPIMPERAVIKGWNEKNASKWRDLLAVNTARNQMAILDKEVSKKAMDNLVIKGDVTESAKKSYDIKGKSYSIDELRAIYREGAQNVAPTNNYPSSAPGYVPTQGAVGPTAKKGSRLEALGFRNVQKIIAATDADTKAIDKEKDRIYRERGTVRQPTMTFAVTGEKDSKLSNNKTLQTAFTERLSTGFIVGEEGLASDYTGKIDPEKVFIKGAYWDRGKLYMRASANVKVDKEEVTKTFDVDITPIREKYPNNGDWFDKTFVQDKYVPLTESLLAPGASGKTPLDPKDGFANSLMVVANNNTARYYSIQKTSGNKFVVKIAIPLGNGKFSMNSYLNTSTGDVDQFNNAGQAIEAADMFYKNPNALIIERNLIGNGK